MSKYIARPFDPVRVSNGGFDEARKYENFNRACNDVAARIRRDGPWATIKRVLGGKVAPQPYDVTTEKRCNVCARVKPLGEFAVSKVHSGRISRRSICKECQRIARRMRRND